MTEENISGIGMIIIFIMVGAFVGSMVTGFLMEDSYIEDLWQDSIQIHKIIKLV